MMLFMNDSPETFSPEDADLTGLASDEFPDRNNEPLAPTNVPSSTSPFYAAGLEPWLGKTGCRSLCRNRTKPMSNDDDTLMLIIWKPTWMAHEPSDHNANTRRAVMVEVEVAT